MSEQLFLSHVDARRLCEWCNQPLRPGARRDTITCSKACRQARHRFRVAPADATDSPMRFAYADPPYPNLSRKYYRDHPDYAGEVNHRALVDRLVAEYPDGWALSTSARALKFVLWLCPDDVRVCPWFRGKRHSGRSRRPPNGWEPVIVWRGRVGEPRLWSITDSLVWGGRQHSHPGALPGMKSAAFCEWLFNQLGAARGDTLDDLYPGSGAVARAWREFSGEIRRTSRLPSRLAGG